MSTNRQPDSKPTVRENGIFRGALKAIRYFWTVEEVHPVAYDEGPGDIMVYAGERWRVQSTQRWGGVSESVAVRLEPGP